MKTSSPSQSRCAQQLIPPFGFAIFPRPGEIYQRESPWQCGQQDGELKSCRSRQQHRVMMTEWANSLKIKIVPPLLGLRGIFFVLCICQQGGGSGVLCFGGKGGGGRKTGFVQHIQRQQGADAVKVLRL